MRHDTPATGGGPAGRGGPAADDADRASAPGTAWRRRQSAPEGDCRPLTYVYAVGRDRGHRRRPLPRLRGLDGGELRAVASDGLRALVSTVPGDAFTTEGLSEQLEDLERLEQIARAHHAVIQAAYETGAVLPMRLATVYLDDERVAEVLHQRAKEFKELLQRLEGHVELGVKVYVDTRAAKAREPVPQAPPASGRDYLQRRRAQQRGHREAHLAAGSVAERVREAVRGRVAGRVVHRLQQGGAAGLGGAEGRAGGGAAGENVLNDAYLVPADRVEDFRAMLAGLPGGAPGVRVEVTGPWAPYSFVTPPPAQEEETR